jgi:hypothetical protein
VIDPFDNPVDVPLPGPVSYALRNIGFRPGVPAWWDEGRREGARQKAVDASCPHCRHAGLSLWAWRRPDGLCLLLATCPNCSAVVTV